MFQVIMPTVEADVAFGLGKSNLTQKEVRSKVFQALDAVGMPDYMQVGDGHFKYILISKS